MVELSLMPSATYPSKEFRYFLPSHNTKQEILRSGYLQLRPPLLEDLWKPTRLLLNSNQSAHPVLTIMRPVLVDIQDTRRDSILFSFGIAEQCTRLEKILQFLVFGSSGAERGGLSTFLLSNLMGLHTLPIDIHPQSPLDDESCLYEIEDGDTRPSLIYPKREFYVEKTLLDLVGVLIHSSKITVHPDGRVLFMGTGAEVKDLLSVIDEFYLLKNSTKCSNQLMLVPHFTRLDAIEAQASIHGTPQKVESVTVAPLKSPERTKLKQSPRKKQSRKAARERDLYRKNYFHACESLLSVILDKRRGKMAILSLKKSGPEVPQLLTQLSTGIAGTGLAVILSVLCKVTNGRVPFCTTKLLNTGFGLGLVWLSWAVNKLKDTIVYISKNSNRLELEEQLMREVDGNVKQVFFRAATLMAVAVLRFA
eukprot:TRINITY_DN21926_c0_g1_i1.p1 TRINITY_DN21926_c0_g1~~TRINITY_DN21926_c0_g1_i1.p1  ORF type:complete len:422 (-),score=58.87 TRINITY_DN21926_c0_g1_i1:242-1507(-)